MITVKVSAYLKLVRPGQWLKNLMIFFPPFLGGTLFYADSLFQGILPFISFCLASSSTYILNDIHDREHDKSHPGKKDRPIASGVVPLVVAYVFGLSLVLLAVAMGLAISASFCLLLVSYLVIQIFYSMKLKELPIIDIFCISAGFLLRLQAGGVVYGITISEWLFLSVFLLSIFLSTGKRLAEMKFLGDRAGEHRKSLASYPAGFLEGVMYMTGGSVLVTYTMFVLVRHTLVYTVPLCCFGLFRYIYRVQSGLSGDPTEALLKDGVLFIVGFLWVVLVWYGYYWSR
jgi:4-hydroxybenzoate polyprenyltransferase